MNRTFSDAETQAIFLLGSSKRFANIGRIAPRKLQAIDFASVVEDLQEPPGNGLEKLRGDRDGQWSILRFPGKDGQSIPGLFPLGWQRCLGFGDRRLQLLRGANEYSA